LYIAYLVYCISCILHILYIAYLVYCTSCILYILYIVHLVYCISCILYILYIVYLVTWLRAGAEHNCTNIWPTNILDKKVTTKPQNPINFLAYQKHRGTQWRRRLRHCATRRKVAGSIPDNFIEIFHWQNPSVYTVALGSTQPLTGINISWGVKTADA